MRTKLSLALILLLLTGCASAWTRPDTAAEIRDADYKDCQNRAGWMLGFGIFAPVALAVDTAALVHIHKCMQAKGYE